ncbi:hypothetical protein [Salinimonas chungwhensis]|uniref:hypothetical protein n=1 Tax=Salinimonas chungwhensis TaxID=265425 RepID=UPI00037F4B77|nr:hypothetical protein [Salinimonas chungwhensis]
MNNSILSEELLGCTQKLCSWANAIKRVNEPKKKKSTDGRYDVTIKEVEKSWLNKLALSVSIYLLSKLESDAFDYTHISMRYDSLSSFAVDFDEFMGETCVYTSDNRLKEALEMLCEIGFIETRRDDSNQNERDNYGYGNKDVWVITVLLDTFDFPTTVETHNFSNKHI